MSDEDFSVNPSDEERISLEASAWVARHDDELSAAEQDAFFEWLAADSRHKEVYRERLAFWKQMNGLADWRPQHSFEMNPDLLATKFKKESRGLKFGRLAGIAAIVVVSLLAFFQFGTQRGEESRVLAFGGAKGYENHLLEDGSVVELNQGAEVSVRYSEGERLIFLHEGEAHFMVAKDAGRPFRVRAGSAVVEATGTAFNVSCAQDGIEVMVTEGVVVVDKLSKGKVAAKTELGGVHQMVAGQITMLKDGEAADSWRIESVTEEAIEKRLDWKSELLEFTDAPLSEIAGDFNRRNRVKIEILDKELRERKVTANLSSDNLEGFIELLGIGMSIEVERPDPFRILIKKGS